MLTYYEGKTIKINKYESFTGDKSKVDSSYYSDKAPFSSLIVYPAYVLYKKLNFKDLPDTLFKKHRIYIWEHVGMPDGRNFLLPKIGIIMMLGDFICGTLPFVIVLLITFLTTKNNQTNGPPIFLLMIAFYGTFLFVYSGTYNGHLLAGLFLFLSYYFIKVNKLFLLSGFMLGLGFATEFPLAIVIPIWALQIWINERNFKNAFLFSIGTLPGILFILYYNHYITGFAFKTAYSYVAHEDYKGVTLLGFGKPNLEAFWGLIFSKFRGIFFYAPILTVMFYYLLKNYKSQKDSLRKGEKNNIIKSLLKNYLFSITILSVLLFSCHIMWYGGWAYGPRHLVPLSTLLLFEGVLFLSRQKYSTYSVVIFGVIGILFSWLAKSTRVFMLPYNEQAKQFSNPIFELLIPDYKAGKLNSNNLLTMFAEVKPETANFIWLFLFAFFTVILTLLYRKSFPKMEPVRNKASTLNQDKKKGKRYFNG